MKTVEKIDFLIAKLGLSDVKFQDAGEGKKFTKSSTRYNLYYTRDAKRFVMPVALTAFDSESVKFFALQNIAAKTFGHVDCPIYEYRSNYASSVKTVCPICGGYGIKPTFEYDH